MYVFENGDSSSTIGEVSISKYDWWQQRILGLSGIHKIECDFRTPWHKKRKWELCALQNGLQPSSVVHQSWTSKYTEVQMISVHLPHQGTQPHCYPLAHSIRGCSVPMVMMQVSVRVFVGTLHTHTHSARQLFPFLVRNRLTLWRCRRKAEALHRVQSRCGDHNFAHMLNGLRQSI
jgi:hypothetical protein